MLGSFIIDRYENAIPICTTKFATLDCLQLNNLKRHIKTLRHPGIASLKIMKGFGETFEALWLNGQVISY